MLCQNFTLRGMEERHAGLELSMHESARWICPQQCGYRREWCLDDLHGEYVIRHPVWGLVTSRKAAELDVTHHDCEEYRRALARSKMRRQHVA